MANEIPQGGPSPFANANNVSGPQAQKQSPNARQRYTIERDGSRLVTISALVIKNPIPDGKGTTEQLGEKKFDPSKVTYHPSQPIPIPKPLSSQPGPIPKPDTGAPFQIDWDRDRVSFQQQNPNARGKAPFGNPPFQQQNSPPPIDKRDREPLGKRDKQ